jgi:hypothetical protein
MTRIARSLAMEITSPGSDFANDYEGALIGEVLFVV